MVMSSIASGRVADVLRRGDRTWRGKAAGECDRLALPRHRERGPLGLLDRDQPGRAQRGDHVVGSAPDSQVVEHLLLATESDGELEGVLAALGRFADLDGSRARTVVLAAVVSRDRAQHQRSAALDGGRQLGAGHCLGPVLGVAVAADPDDVGRSAAVEEIPVHGVREIGVFGESAEGLGELGPVGHQYRFVERSPLGETDERGNGRADAFDRPGAGRDLLQVDAGREVVGHGASVRAAVFPATVSNRPAPAPRSAGQHNTQAIRPEGAVNRLR
jgi:hypothetical protein